MRILFLDSPAFAKQDMIDAFEACNITCDLFFIKIIRNGKVQILRNVF